MRYLLFALSIMVIACQPATTNSPSFSVTFPSSLKDSTYDGRLLLMLSNNDEAEPRFQISEGLTGQIIFGLNIDGWKPGEEINFDDTVFGYPYESLADVPEGEYLVQALLHTYETFNLSTGHTVKLPVDDGEGQRWNRSPGNLYSTPQSIIVKSGSSHTVAMDKIIEPIPKPTDTEWVKHIKFKSERLSKFWGKDTYLGAHILLPKGFNEHPEAKYPLMIFHGHFPSDFGGWRTTPPDPEMAPQYSERFDVEGYNVFQQQEAYDFYKRWNEPDFPRMIIIEI